VRRSVPSTFLCCGAELATSDRNLLTPIRFCCAERYQTAHKTVIPELHALRQKPDVVSGVTEIKGVPMLKLGFTDDTVVYDENAGVVRPSPSPV
jgi:hypothetical protein